MCTDARWLCEKTNTRSAKHYKDLFDLLARGIFQYQQRLLCMDASMALWAVVPELRARGFLVTMVSFFPSMNYLGKVTCSDTLGVFIIGNHGPIRMAYGPDVFDYKAGRQPKANRPMMKHIVFNQMHILDGPFPVYQFKGERRGPGYPMSSFIPRTKPGLKNNSSSVPSLPLTCPTKDRTRSYRKN